MREITVEAQSWPIAGAFTISRGSKTEARVVVATVTEMGLTGQGECVPYARYGETEKDVIAAIKAQAHAIAEGMSREQLQRAMPRGAARNALDCAMWDLEAKLAGKQVWELAGLDAPRAITTAYTLSLGTPDEMREAAGRAAHRTLLKLKLGGGGDEDIARVEAVRAGAPNAALIVDANEGWKPEQVLPMAHELARLGVSLIEQPVPAAEDEVLRGIESPVPLCADESAHGLEGMRRLVGLYDFINVKLDKTGGLTEALSVVRCAKRRNLRVMVGCMVSTSLAMAPATLIAQHSDYVDLDGPLLLAQDRDPALRYEGSLVYPPARELWG
ncbi:N-acetyl-D-Glu racemase DgcA [Parvibaculum sp.]|uniref:N-acetyl-D-Glu racemase DgcA n=1 Tax=Parvibaculum sp. TaxID=2024848 RepID=UPI00272EF64D|nr:N-acetyl-D-Glu racemase DgcA [Parvibaculum sp.]MDP1627062.1 dipeptide epimerase [Parvibaculum sp.]MDP2149347.1 dipeptide epimerase [Parvibaculum sp.]MDP3326816.1 dipeptide epimerase [Parvibaculum sp.]